MRASRHASWRCLGAHLASVAIVLLAVFGPASLSAQTVRGIVTRIGVPVPGVVVQLVDADATVVARTITDETGAYRLLAPRAGSYRLTTRRIGFAPTTSTAISIGAGETRIEALPIDGVAIRLDTVRVATAKGCLRLDAANSEVSAIWEQAKTALLATEATLSERTFSASLLSYRREIEPDGGQILQSLSLLEIDSVAQPWSSRSVEELRKSGYVVRGKDDSTSYLAPGLDVLVSKQFASDHCFRLEDTDDNNTLGLAFQPAKPDRRLVELQGTMRVDRSTSELRSLEFRYTNLLPAVEKAGAGGRLEFARLRDGSWVISRWSIRMPALAVAMPTGRGLRGLMESAKVAGVDLAGGDLFVARRGTDTLWSRPLPTVAGLITDSATGRTIAGARLRLRESGRAVYSDSAGRFDFGTMLPGQYTLLSNTPSLDSLGAVSALALPVTDAMASLSVRVPDAFRVLPAVCRLPADSVAARRHIGVLRGTVTRDSALTDTSSAIDVVVQWSDTAAKSIRTARATADELGRYRLCDMPMDTKLEVRADLSAVSSAVTVVQLDTISPFAAADLRVEPLAPDQGIVRGEVVDKSGAPLDNVSIEFPQLGLRATTDARGRYVVPRLPGGRQLVSVRRLGYTPADTTLVVSAGGLLEQRWVLENVATLAEVNTTASRAWAREFDEHRKIGLGQFLTREELAKREAQRLGDLMVMMRGTKVMRSGQSASYLATSRPRTQRGECYAHVWLDGNPMYLGRPSEPLYNMNELLVLQIEAIEYYAGPADTPAKYNNLNANCGVLVVHTRRD